MKKCFFIGHRECSDKLYMEIQCVLYKCISEYEAYEFIVGRYGQFDHLAAKCVIEAKKKYPQVTLTMLLPYLPAERKADIPEGLMEVFIQKVMSTFLSRLQLFEPTGMWWIMLMFNCICLGYSKQRTKSTGTC